MNQIAITPGLREEDVSEIRSLLARRSGVAFEGALSDAFYPRLRHYMQNRRLFSSQEALHALRRSGAEYDALLHALLAQESEFFRCREMFHAFQENVLGELRKRKFWDDPRGIKVLSAGCGSGEEAYSIALSVSEALEASDGWNVTILAADVDRLALRHAERGVYPRHALEALTRQQLDAGFARIGDQFLVKPSLRKLATFKAANLAERVPLGRFDCIFCLDVLEYLPGERRAAVLEHLADSLEPGGYLLLGEGDATCGVPGNLEYIADDALLYRKKFAATL